jgi:hypothetical protein
VSSRGERELRASQAVSGGEADHERHAQMLQQKFGIDPGKLAEKALEKELR